MNRLVEIQSRAVVRDSFGGEIVTWPTLATVWAAAKVTGVSENFKNDARRRVPIRNAEFRILWRADVRESSRLIYRGLIWDIKGIKAIGRLYKLNLFCQSDVSRNYTP